ncbi:MAG: hypothetical protein ACREPT_13775, partial [Rudaea sp.]
REDGKNHEAAEKFIKYASSDTGKTIIRKHHLVPYDDAPNLVGNESARAAFVDAHVATAPATAVAVAVAASTPVSAPNATADYLVRTQPNSLEAQEAKQRAAQARADKKAAKAADKSN